MIRWVRFALGAIAALTFSAWVWTLLQSPFAEPYRDRSEAELRVALERLLAPELASERIAARIDTALTAGETNEAAALGRLAETRGVALPDRTRDALAEAIEASTGLSACLACAWDPASCASFSQVAACSLPAELTPLGDFNAIRRGAQEALLRYAQNSDDLARIAQVTETGGIFALLGKARVFRATKKLAEIAVLAIGLLSALASQALAAAL